MKLNADSQLDRECCDNCGGTGRKPQIAFGEQPESIKLLGKDVRVIGEYFEKVCPHCEGSGLSPPHAEPESCYDYVKRRGDLTDDSRKLANMESSLVLSQFEVAQLVQRMEFCFGQNQSPDSEEPFAEGLPAIAMPVNQNLQVVGDPFAALVTEVSLKGVHILHTDAIGPNFVLMELMMPDEETVDFVAKVVCRLRIGTTRETWCEFVTK